MYELDAMFQKYKFISHDASIVSSKGCADVD